MRSSTQTCRASLFHSGLMAHSTGRAAAPFCHLARLSGSHTCMGLRISQVDLGSRTTTSADLTLYMPLTPLFCAAGVRMPVHTSRQLSSSFTEIAG